MVKVTQKDISSKKKVPSKAPKSKMDDHGDEELSEEEKEEAFAENRERLSIAHQIAKEVFKADAPIIAQTSAIADFLKSGAERDNVAAFFTEAVAVLTRLGWGGTPPPSEEYAELARDLSFILLDDEQSEEHIKDAEVMAQQMFGASPRASTILDVYYQLYGLDHVYGDEP